MVKFELNLASLYGIKEDGTPKRISMFPPSYAERAIMRARQRQILREEAEAKEAVARKQAETQNFENLKKEVLKLVEQKAMAPAPKPECLYCKTPKQKPNASSTKEQKTQDNNDAQNGKGKKTQAEKEPKGDNDKGGKQKNQTNDSEPKNKRGNKDETKPKEDPSKNSKPAGNEPKEKVKEKTDLNPMLSSLWSPPASVYPWAYDRDRWTDQRRALEYAAKAHQDAAEAARKSDQEVAERWLTEANESVKHGAFRWLKERDAARHGMDPDSYYGRDGASLNQVRSTPTNLATNRFQNVPTKQNGNFYSLPWSTESKGHSGPNQPRAETPNMPFVVYQNGDKLLTQDGQEVVVVSAINGGSGSHDRNTLQQVNNNAVNFQRTPTPFVYNQAQPRDTSQQLGNHYLCASSNAPVGNMQQELDNQFMGPPQNVNTRPTPAEIYGQSSVPPDGYCNFQNNQPNASTAQHGNMQIPQNVGRAAPIIPQANNVVQTQCGQMNGVVQGQDHPQKRNGKRSGGQTPSRTNANAVKHKSKAKNNAIGAGQVDAGGWQAPEPQDVVNGASQAEGHIIQQDNYCNTGEEGDLSGSQNQDLDEPSTMSSQQGSNLNEQDLIEQGEEGWVDPVPDAGNQDSGLSQSKDTQNNNKWNAPEENGWSTPELTNVDTSNQIQGQNLRASRQSKGQNRTQGGNKVDHAVSGLIQVNSRGQKRSTRGNGQGVSFVKKGQNDPLLQGATADKLQSQSKKTTVGLETRW